MTGTGRGTTGPHRSPAPPGGPLPVGLLCVGLMGLGSRLCAPGSGHIRLCQGPCTLWAWPGDLCLGTGVPAACEAGLASSAMSEGLHLSGSWGTPLLVLGPGTPRVWGQQCHCTGILFPQPTTCSGSGGQLTPTWRMLVGGCNGHGMAVPAPPVGTGDMQCSDGVGCGVPVPRIGSTGPTA